MSAADRPGASGVDPAVARALDQFDVPPPSAGFTARMAAIPDAAPHSITSPIPGPRWRARAQRFGRGPWMRRTAIGLIAVGLASATAAAAGIFTSVRFDIPVIARLMAPKPAEPPLARAVRAKPRPIAVAQVAAKPAVPPVIVSPDAPRLLTPAERAERFRALPMPVRAVVTERMVTRTQRRLAERGLFLPRALVRDRVVARTGQTDLPTGTPADRRAQARAALIAAPPGSLPPRFERMRARLIAQRPDALAGSEKPAAGAQDSSIASAQAQQAWRELQRDRALRWRARRMELAARSQQSDMVQSEAAQALPAPPAEPAEPASPAPE